MPGSVCNQKGNDLIYTPPKLAKAIVEHFNPSGLILEPCKGQGAFTKIFKKRGLNYKWCEIERGRDFLTYSTKHKFDWIITNPPFSKISLFLQKSCELSADNIVFLIYLTAITTSGKLNILKKYSYAIQEIAFINNQKKVQQYGWKQSGFALTAIHFKRTDNEWDSTKISHIDW